jgi:hypothetical protein
VVVPEPDPPATPMTKGFMAAEAYFVAAAF